MPQHELPAKTCTRRSLILRAPGLIAAMSGVGLLSNTALNPARAAGMEFGAQGGDPFPMTYPKTVGVRWGAYVDALVLNGQQYGGSGGNNPVTIDLNNTYINKIDVRQGRYIDRLYLTAADGQSTGGGGDGGSPYTLSGIRVTRMGGRSASLLDNLKVDYVANYRPSARVASAKLVLDFMAPGQTITTVSESRSLISKAYAMTSELMQSLKVTASAEGEYYAKFAASTELNVSSTTTTSIKEASEQELRRGQTVTETLQANEIKVLIGDVDIMQDANGAYFMLPTLTPQWAKISTQDAPKRLANYFTLVSGMEAQIGVGTRVEYNNFHKLVARR